MTAKRPRAGVRSRVPDRGDLLWLEFTEHVVPRAGGHEQAGRRPALVISPKAYNARTGLAIVCPVTSHVKGYPFEVPLPHGLPIQGAILSDQVRTVDWRARKARHVCSIPTLVTDSVRQRLATLV